MKFHYLHLKYFLDFIFALLALVVLSPLLSLIAILVYIFHGNPIVFTQSRPGLNGRPFLIYKFRTMTNATDINGTLLPDHLRLTRFGRILRSTSMDELPELINIIRGEMSFIGPRPLLMQYLDLYTREQFRRHDVRPGFSGWAQVNGRNLLSWEEKFLLDVWYVDNFCFTLDFYILFLTVFKVLSRQGISSPSHSTVSFFTGSSNND